MSIDDYGTLTRQKLERWLEEAREELRRNEYERVCTAIIVETLQKLERMNTEEFLNPWAGRGYRMPEGRWAAFFDRCEGCGGTDRAHVGHGYCSPCYQRAKRAGAA